jgi:FixJ family two-component response regulator
MNDMTELFLVDDEPDVTSSLHWLLQTVGRKATAFNSPQEFLQYFATFTGPCCVVLDLRMPGLTGIEVLERIVGTRHDTPVVFLTGHGDVPSAVRAMKLGAYDFLVKPFNPQGFLECINRACRHAMESHQQISRKKDNREILSKLSTREHDIFDRVIAGMSSKEIGRALDISPKTVDVHRASIMKKIGVSTYRELMRKFRVTSTDAIEDLS